jgi:hypothetical protein
VLYLPAHLHSNLVLDSAQCWQCDAVLLYQLFAAKKRTKHSTSDKTHTLPSIRISDVAWRFTVRDEGIRIHRAPGVHVPQAVVFSTRKVKLA